MTRERIVRAAVAFAVGAFVFAGASAASAATDDAVDDQGNLTVTVTDGSTPTPSPSGAVSNSGVSSGGVSNGGNGSSGGATGGAGGSNNAGGTGGTNGGTTTPGTTGTTSTAGTSGILTMGGLTTSPSISVDPFGGTVRLWFTVRNESKSVIDGAARFWMTSWLFGIPLDEQTVAVGALQPGESRVVSAELHGAGQWTLVDTHVTLTPPETIDGTKVKPITRDALVFVFPWLLVAAAGVALLGILAARVWQRFRVASPVAREPA